MVQLSVLDRDLTTPPGSPIDGDRYIVASGATGLWAGWDLNVTTWVDGVWMRLVPRPGWLVWIADEATVAVWTGTIWKLVGVPQDVSYQRPFQLTCAQVREVMEAMATGSFAKKFHAVQHASTMSS